MREPFVNLANSMLTASEIHVGGKQPRFISTPNHQNRASSQQRWRRGEQQAKVDSMGQIDNQQCAALRRLEMHELVQNGKRALCGAYLLFLAVSAAAILTVLSLPSGGTLGSPEGDIRLIERLRTPVALAAGKPERDATQASLIGEPGFDLVYAPTTPQVVQTFGPESGTDIASLKHVQIQPGAVAAKLASHRKRSHPVLAHVGERHRRTAIATVGHQRHPLNLQT